MLLLFLTVVIRVFVAMLSHFVVVGRNAYMGISVVSIERYVAFTNTMVLLICLTFYVFGLRHRYFSNVYFLTSFLFNNQVVNI